MAVGCDPHPCLRPPQLGGGTALHSHAVQFPSRVFPGSFSLPRCGWPRDGAGTAAVRSAHASGQGQLGRRKIGLVVIQDVRFCGLVITAMGCLHCDTDRGRQSCGPILSPVPGSSCSSSDILGCGFGVWPSVVIRNRSEDYGSQMWLISVLRRSFPLVL